MKEIDNSQELKPLLKIVITELEKRIQEMPPYGDMADYGNEIGYSVGQAHHFTEQDITDFIIGLQHGISLTNGTH